jgi:hypothetical protein
MKSASEWGLSFLDYDLDGFKSAKDFIEAIQRDALEAAAKVCDEVREDIESGRGHAYYALAAIREVVK